MIETADFHLEAIDLLINHLPCYAAIDLIAAIYSGLKKHSILSELLKLEEFRIQGKIKAIHFLAKPLQIGMDNSARHLRY